MSEVFWVTGANGFIGRHACKAASAAGYQVFGIGHGDWTEDTWRGWGLSAWHELDVSLSSLAAHAGQPDAIIHCAGSGSVGFSLENPAQDFERTVDTTVEVLEFIRTCSPSTRLVYPSSAAVYGRARTLPIQEGSPLAPVSPYGMHKKIAEDLCRSYSSNFGLQVAIVRIFSAYGRELRKQLLWDASQKVRHGVHDFAGTGMETRDWVSVEDVATLLLTACDYASGDAVVVNGASGIEVSTSEILMALFDALGEKGVPQFTGTARSGDPERYSGDPTRAMAWGWTPEKHWLDGVREYAKWFLEASE